MKTIVAAIVVSSSAFAAQAATVDVSTVLDAQQTAAALNNVLAPSAVSGIVETNVVGSISTRRSPYDDVPALADTGKYHSIQSNASMTYAFNDLQDSFTLLWGSPDNYNFLSFFNGQDLVDLGSFGDALTGDEIAPLGPIEPLGKKFGVVTVSDILFDRVVLSSTRNAFEFGLVSSTPAPVPLPAAAWMLLAGLGALAGIGRARRAA